MKADLETLEHIARNSRYAEGPSTQMTIYSYELFARHYRGGSVLEMGPAEGNMTELLDAACTELTIVEGSQTFAEDLRQRFPGTPVFHSTFEDFEPGMKFDAIVMGHVLEHVDDPIVVLKKVREWLAPGGFVFCVVPNSRSLHRQAGVLLGMLEEETSMSELDYAHGHQRIYSPETFRADFHKAGFTIDVFGGYWMKTFSNGQLAKILEPEALRAFFILGERYPDIAAEIYVVAR